MKLTILLFLTLLFNTGCFYQSPSNSNQNQTNKIEEEQYHDTAPALILSPTTLPDAIVGKPYNVKISVTNQRTPIGGVSVKGEQLPEGLSIKKMDSSGEGVEISGTPTEAGKFMFTVSVWCYGTQVSGQTANREYKMKVKGK